MGSKRWITCACCGGEGRLGSGSWRESCYRRWLLAGRPDTGPPPLKRRTTTGGHSVSPTAVAGRIEDYTELTRDHGLTLYQAAERLHVSERTAFRYERRIRQAVNQ